MDGAGKWQIQSMVGFQQAKIKMFFLLDFEANLGSTQ